MTREPGWSFKPIGNNNNKTFWVFYAFSAQLLWFNSCFFSQLSYNCLDGSISSFNTLWSCSPKCKKCWCKLGHFPHIKALTDSALSLNEEIAIDCNKEQERPLSRLQKKKRSKIWMWLVIHRSVIRLVRCGRNYNHTLLKISYKWGERRMGPEPTQSLMVAQQTFIVHCSICLLYPCLYVESGAAYITSHREKQTRDSCVRAHTCFTVSFVFTSTYRQFSDYSWIWAKELK